jgi:hypothetical protein
MKKLPTLILAGALGTAIPAVAQAGTCDGVPQACSDSATDALFTQNKRVCYETLAACGRYQEIADRIVVQQQGIPPQEQYFLGLADFGLANRTASHSFQCFYSVRAKQNLESFLVDRQILFRQQTTFGTTDEMKYVGAATNMLASLKTRVGCEESGYTELGMERYARGYALQRVKDLFYNTGGTDGLQTTFNAQVGSLQGMMQQFVSTAAQIEARFGVTQSEIEAGRQYLSGLKDKLNGIYAQQFPNGAVLVANAPITQGGNDLFPSFAYDAGWQPLVTSDLNAGIAHYSSLLDPANPSGIAAVRQAVLTATNAVSEEDYVARKAAFIEQVHAQAVGLFMAANFWAAVEGKLQSNGPDGGSTGSTGAGINALNTALSAPATDGVVQSAAALNARWRDGMQRFCTPTAHRWYCAKG